MYLVRSPHVVEFCLGGSIFETLWEKGELSFTTKGRHPLPTQFVAVVTHRAHVGSRSVDGRSMAFAEVFAEMQIEGGYGVSRSKTYTYQVWVAKVVRMEQGSLLS